MDGSTFLCRTLDNSPLASPSYPYPSSKVTTSSNSVVPDASAAALEAHRYQEDEKGLRARHLLLQQRHQADDHDSLVAAAMAKASSNLMANGQFHVNQDAFLYQRALLERQTPLTGLPPDRAGVAQKPALSVSTKDTKGAALSPHEDSTESEGSESDRDEAASKGKNEDADVPKDDDMNYSSKHRPYFDGSLYPDPPTTDEESGEEDEDIKLPMHRRKPAEPFPQKLYRIIEEAKMNGEENIISFFSHGRAFGIHKPRKFIEVIMPKYFATERMSSFQRQLNLCKYRNVCGTAVCFVRQHGWSLLTPLPIVSLLLIVASDGFRRISDGRDKGGFYHEFFLEGRKGLLKKIKRKNTRVPKAKKGDTARSKRISKSKAPTANHGMDSAMPSYPTLQQMLMMSRGSLPVQGSLLGMGGGMTSYGSFNGPSSPARGQMLSTMGAPGAGNDILYGGSPFGAQSYMGCAPPM